MIGIFVGDSFFEDVMCLQQNLVDFSMEVGFFLFHDLFGDVKAFIKLMLLLDMFDEGCIEVLWSLVDAFCCP